MGFVDYFRMGMGWWSNPPAAPAVIGSILVDRVECGPSVLVDGYDRPEITIDDYSLTTSDIEVGGVEVL